jgi:hypothetical protein
MRGEDHWARADHGHAGLPLAFGLPVAIDPDDAQAEGVAATIARSDHQHAMAAGTPVTIGTANAEGVAASVARSDHVHNIGTEIGAIGASCRLARTTNQAITTGTSTPISWDSEISDPFAMHSAVNPSRLIAPWAGYYGCSATIHWVVNTGGNFRKCTVNPNGAGQFQGLSTFGPLGVNTQPINHICVLGILLAAAEYVEIEVDHDAGSNRDVGGDALGTNFTMVNFTYLGPG